METSKRKHGWIVRHSKSRPGKMYYHNTLTRQSTWTRPEEFVERDIQSSKVSPEKKGHKRHRGRSSTISSTSTTGEATDEVTQQVESNEYLGVATTREILSARRSSQEHSNPTTAESSETKQESSNSLQGNKMRKTIKAVRRKTREGDQDALASSQIVSTSMRSEEGVDNNHFDTPNRVLKSPTAGNEKMSNKQAEPRHLKETPPSSSSLLSSLPPGPIQSRKRRYSKNLAEDRLHTLQQKLKEERESKQEVSQHQTCLDSKERKIVEKNYEPMDFEFEVINNIGELRQQDAGLQLTKQPIFMDMDIDHSVNIAEPELTFYVVLDTNILLSHLKFAEELRDTVVAGKGPVHLYLPWQVLHELDHLKDKGKTSIQPLARRAINYLHQNFSSKHPRVCGQKIRCATDDSSNSSPDDNILEACLQLKRQGFTNVVLLSNDVNLLNKGLVNDIQALSKDEFAQQLCVNSTHISAGSTASQNLPEPTLSDEVCAGNNNFKTDVVLSEMKSVLKDFFTKIVSKGMEEEYKYLWEKRTIIPPPWNVEQALQCLSYHWMAICGSFIPQVVKKCTEDLKHFFKVKAKCDRITVADLKSGIGLAESLLESIPKKYKSIVVPALQNIKTMLLKLDEAFSPRKDESCTASTEKSDFKYSTLLTCFEEALSAARSLCDPIAVSQPDWRINVGCMIEALQKLTHLLNLLLQTTFESLSDEHPVVVDLVKLIKGNHQISAQDLINFIKEDRNRNLLEVGIQQFEDVSTHLTKMAHSNIIL
ncbi:transcriptional protein SWT1 isoform X1 [Frankliniella occidentalis]|uniref:Transcriptional protein SWT1 isoform X1 n=2 Tax=Frankliniella occidentalis TaxID=133901 RepID=A0A6J1SVJ0_FRAOC|nr:transcriptional protein SWT1 isoform X1 [Frankliniella occidentalis]